MADKKGVLYDGDRLIYIIARHRQQKGTLRGGVAGTLMTNLAVENGLKKEIFHLLEPTSVTDMYWNYCKKMAGNLVAKAQAILFVSTSTPRVTELFPRYKFCTPCATRAKVWPNSPAASPFIRSSSSM